MYITLIQTVAKKLAEESQDNSEYYRRIVMEFDIQHGTDNRKHTEYLIEHIYKYTGWGGVFDVVFGDDPMTSNDGIDGIYECVISMHTRYIQEQSEHGHNRMNLFENTMRNEPAWLKEMVAESEVDFYHGQDPAFLSEEEIEYMNMLENIIEEQ